MADGNDNPATTPTTATAPAAPAQQPSAPAPETVTLTRSELDALLTERANSAAAAARRAEQGKQKPTAEPTHAPEPRVTEKPVSSMTATEVKRLLAFNRAVGAHGFSDAQVTDLEALLDVQQPEDLSGWVAQKAQAWGAGKPATATTNNTPPAQPATQTQPSAPSPAVAPSGSSSPASVIADKLAMSPDMMKAYLRTQNYNPHNRFTPDSRKAIRAVAEEGRRLLESVQVLPPDRGRDG
jgi:hypothetical protein